MIEYAIWIGIGAIVGFAGGLFAIGGALIAIPLLTAAFGFSQHESQGTAALMALASAAVTLTVFVRSGLVRIRDGLVMAAVSTLFGLLFSQLVRFVPDGALQRGFGILLLVLAIALWFSHLGEGSATAALPAPIQTGIGALAGALSGFFIIGGGLVTVPLLERVGGYSQQKAQAMTLLMLVPASVVGFCSYAGSGYVHWETAVPLAIGSVALAPAGAKVALALKPRLLRRLFAIVQAAAGVILIVGK
jgi:uncharacterized protein